MSDTAASTLSEVSRKLAGSLFTMFNTFDPISWQIQNQVIYTMETNWEVCYKYYFNRAKIRDVKYPFCCIMRDGGQDSTKLFNKALSVKNTPLANSNSVKGAKIKPSRIGYSLVIWEDALEDIERWTDFLIINSNESQRTDFYSNVLEQNSRISFTILEPEHAHRADEAEGYIYGLLAPVVVDCVLGYKEERKYIKEINSNTTIDNGNNFETNIIT